jgi:hypothetical protein
MLYAKMWMVLVCLLLAAPGYACPTLVFSPSKSAGHKTHHEKKNKNDGPAPQSKPSGDEKPREVHA